EIIGTGASGLGGGYGTRCRIYAPPKPLLVPAWTENDDLSAFRLTLLTQSIALAPGSFEVETEILDVELILVDRILGGLDKAMLPPRPGSDFLTQRQQSTTLRSGERLHQATQLHQFANNVFVLAAARGHGEFLDPWVFAMLGSCWLHRCSCLVCSIFPGIGAL